MQAEDKIKKIKNKQKRAKRIKTIIILAIVIVVIVALYYCYSFYMDNQRWPWQKEVLDTNFFVNEPVYTKAIRLRM